MNWTWRKFGFYDHILSLFSGFLFHLELYEWIIHWTINLFAFFRWDFTIVSCCAFSKNTKMIRSDMRIGYGGGSNIFFWISTSSCPHKPKSMEDEPKLRTRIPGHSWVWNFTIDAHSLLYEYIEFTLYPELKIKSRNWKWDI